VTENAIRFQYSSYSQCEYVTDVYNDIYLHALHHFQHTVSLLVEHFSDLALCLLLCSETAAFWQNWPEMKPQLLLQPSTNLFQDSQRKDDMRYRKPVFRKLPTKTKVENGPSPIS